MNKKYSIKFTGKILEIVRPDEKCFVKIQIEPFLLELTCPESCDFHLEDKVFLDGEIIIKNLRQFENLISNSTNKNGGAR